MLRTDSRGGVQAAYALTLCCVALGGVIGLAFLGEGLGASIDGRAKTSIRELRDADSAPAVVAQASAAALLSHTADVAESSSELVRRWGSARMAEEFANDLGHLDVRVRLRKSVESERIPFELSAHARDGGEVRVIEGHVDPHHSFQIETRGDQDWIEANSARFWSIVQNREALLVAADPSQKGNFHYPEMRDVLDWMRGTLEGMDQNPKFIETADKVKNLVAEMSDAEFVRVFDRVRSWGADKNDRVFDWALDAFDPALAEHRVGSVARTLEEHLLSDRPFAIEAERVRLQSKVRRLRAVSGAAAEQHTGDFLLATDQELVDEFLPYGRYRPEPEEFVAATAGVKTFAEYPDRLLASADELLFAGRLRNREFGDLADDFMRFQSALPHGGRVAGANAISDLGQRSPTFVNLWTYAHPEAGHPRLTVARMNRMRGGLLYPLELADDTMLDGSLERTPSDHYAHDGAHRDQQLRADLIAIEETGGDAHELVAKREKWLVELERERSLGARSNDVGLVMWNLDHEQYVPLTPGSIVEYLTGDVQGAPRTGRNPKFAAQSTGMSEPEAGAALAWLADFWRTQR